MTGSPAAAEVTATIRSRFVAAGYNVRDLPFNFSTWPGRFAITAAGGIYVAAMLVGVILLLTGRGSAGVLVLAAVFPAIGILVATIHPAMDGLPWGRRTGVNLLAVRASRRPRYILMAHRDTKSQLVPLALRAPTIFLATAIWLALVLIGMIGRYSTVEPWFYFALGVLGLLAGAVLILCWADDESPGALDNASGVAALIGIAARERDHGDVAFLITDAEELGLAGARAIARQLPPVFGVINMDGLDDQGPFYVMERFGWPRRGIAPHLAMALLSAAAQDDVLAIRRDVPLGILLDHMPVVDAGIPAVTLMRGSLRSLGRVHRVIDDVDHLDGSGVTAAVSLVSAALRILRTQESARPV